MKQSNKKSYLCRAPSNIALIKYWGKRDEVKQWPANDSISMTLKHLYSETAVSLADEDSITLNDEVLNPNSQKASKILQQLDRLRQAFDCDLRFAIQSKNSFPTGCGIASSASGLAALTVATVAAIHDAASFEELAKADINHALLADLARQGSGSAGRSLFGGFVKWSSDEQNADQVIRPIASSDWDLRDAVVIFSDQEKSISSTDAHRLAWSSPLFPVRLAGLTDKISACEAAIARQSLPDLGAIIEQEALEMHAVIMTANPPNFYFSHPVSEFLAALRRLRQNSGLEVYFTMDAGPNVHLIYEAKTETALLEKLGELLPGTRILTDQIGEGPLLWTSL